MDVGLGVCAEAQGVAGVTAMGVRASNTKSWVGPVFRPEHTMNP